jgi:16S rRNA (uracil1498-N3)-methyltransferase
MRLHRFYTESNLEVGDEVTIHSENLMNQIRKVFHFEKGDGIIMFKDSGFDYVCEIAGFNKQDILLKILSRHVSRFMPSRKVGLYMSLIKKDNFEWVAEKATELGVTDIIPVIAEHSEKKGLNIERLNKIVVEASEQSGRGNVPTIHPIISLNEAIESLNSSNKENADTIKIAFHTDVAQLSSIDADSNKSLAIFIGPEGGWSPEEIMLFHDNNFQIKCLGRQVLRAETAAIATLSQFVFKK